MRASVRSFVALLSAVVAVSSCLDLDIGKPCVSNVDCLAGRVCDGVRKVCVDAPASDVGPVTGDGAVAPDAGGDNGTADGAMDVGWSDAGDDTGDAGEDDGTVDGGWLDAGEDAGAETGTDGGMPDAGWLDAGGDASDRDAGTDAGCVPYCGAKQCGDDGCGGSCGECDNPPANACADSSTRLVYETPGACESFTCQYSSHNENCAYGCTGSTCNSCAPNCAGKDCGDDGCGGTCGTCQTCKNVCDAGGVCKATPHAIYDCDVGDVYWFDSCGVKEDVKADCTASQVCYNFDCCTPDCAGKCEGTPDNCGGSCTTCPAGFRCQGGTCAPCGQYDQQCCTPDICNAGFACSGGVCKKTAGMACSLPPDCANSFCKDGFCCNVACDGACEACSSAKKGSGPDGTCGAVPVGSDPDGECPAQICAGDLNSVTLAGTCNGTGACGGGGTQSCLPYKCNAAAGACRTDCTGTGDCQAGYECSVDKCKKSDGQPCSTGPECASSVCKDGVCCNEACDALCEACSAGKKGSGSDGTCGAVAAGSDPDAECATDAASTCQKDGACPGTRGSCRLYAAGTVCAAATCSGSRSYFADTCDGAGTCKDGGTENCSPYACNAGTGLCRTQCASSSECASGYDCTPNSVCAVSSCVGKNDFTPCEVVTTPDRSYDICVGGTCISPGCGDATCNEPGPHFPLPDTDQHACYDNSAPMTCTAFPCNVDGTPTFCGQDAQYGWDMTHSQTERFTRTEPVADQPIVKDNVTGLTWQGCASGLSGATCGTGTLLVKSWADAPSYCDGLSWGSYTDWRLPDSFELQSIADYGRVNPAVDPTAFPATPSSNFWSSSSYAGDAAYAFYVYFNVGYMNRNAKTNSYAIRCVRGAPESTAPRFSKTEPIAGQPIVSDSVTGLTWHGCAAGLSGAACGTGSASMYTWQNAVKFCEELSWGNQNDWRMPNVAELGSLVARRQTNPAIDTTAFPATPASMFQSSSTYAYATTKAWGVLFSDGYVDGNAKTGTFYVRCVRGGRDERGGYGQACLPGDACSAGYECSQGTCVADTCVGKNDFTLCNVASGSPDRSYDICVGGTCVSPGCGDATCNEPGPHFALPDTDQRACYNDTTSVACTAFPCNADGTPAFCGQDAQYGWDTTHAQAERFTQTMPVSNEPVVQDNITGLLWQGCSAGRSGSACGLGGGTMMGWAVAISYCESLSWGDNTDWRLPDPYELRSIVDYSRTNPAIDQTAFPATTNNSFWTSSSYLNDVAQAWAVAFTSGIVGESQKSAGYPVRCVRGIPVPRPARFSRTEPAAGQPIVVDNTTGLTWQGCVAGLSGTACGTGSAAAKTWQDALNYCEGLNWGGQTDWHAPDVGELNSIVDMRRRVPSVDVTAFPATSSVSFWSSSQDAGGGGYAWQVEFGNGAVDGSPKTLTFNVRCVRGGQ